MAKIASATITSVSRHTLTVGKESVVLSDNGVAVSVASGTPLGKKIASTILSLLQGTPEPTGGAKPKAKKRRRRRTKAEMDAARAEAAADATVQ